MVPVHPPMTSYVDPDLFCDSPTYLSRSMVPVHPPMTAYVDPDLFCDPPAYFSRSIVPVHPPRWGLHWTPTSFATPLLTFLALWSRCTPPMGPSLDPDLFCDSPAYFARFMVP